MGDCDPEAPAAEGEFRIDDARPGEGVVLLALHGEADLHVAGELRDAVSGAVDDGVSSLVVDLTEVTFVDSMTLGILVGAAKQMRVDGGDMRLVIPNSPIRRILEVTLLDRVFPLHETRDDALAATR